MLDHNQIIDTVIRDYIGVLNRYPDQAGLNFWVGAVESGAIQLPDVVTGMAEFLDTNSWYGGADGSDTATVFTIEQMYLATQNRFPDQEGQAFWLANGVTNAELLQVLTTTPEFISYTADDVSVWKTWAASNPELATTFIPEPGSFLFV